MNEQEQDLAAKIYAAMNHYSINSERGMQAKEFRVGVSDLGYCSERTRRMLDRQVPEDTDMLLAFLGTAIGDHVEKAIETSWEGGTVLLQQEVTVKLHGERGTYDVSGHPDMVFPQDGIMLDAKTSYGLDLARRVGADQQKMFQRHCYGKGALDAGLFDPSITEDNVQVGNVWIDRSGKTREVHVQIEPLDLDVIEEAGRWVDDVVYAYTNGEEARKEPAREVCAAMCGFYAVCRQWDTDVSGLLTDETVLQAVQMYREGAEFEKLGKSLKDQAKPVLEGMAGSTGEFTLRWVHVNESEVPAFTRKAYDRLDLRKMKR